MLGDDLHHQDHHHYRGALLVHIRSSDDYHQDVVAVTAGEAEDA